MAISQQTKKIIITKEMVNSYPLNKRFDLRTALIKWWINSRVSGGLRLSSAGFKLLYSMDYTTHIFEADNLSATKNLLILDKKLECPYYIDGLGCNKSNITLFGNQEATLIILYGGFNSYLATLHSTD